MRGTPPAFKLFYAFLMLEICVDYRDVIIEQHQKSKNFLCIIKFPKEIQRRRQNLSFYNGFFFEGK